jgi:hypothetical protein
VASKCSLEKQIIDQQVQIFVPQVSQHITDDDLLENKDVICEKTEVHRGNKSASNWLFALVAKMRKSHQEPDVSGVSKPVEPSRESSTSIKLGLSRIIVCIGDLTTEKVSCLMNSRTHLVRRIIGRHDRRVFNIGSALSGNQQSSWCTKLEIIRV